jgi:hypothetical protein
MSSCCALAAISSRYNCTPRSPKPANRMATYCSTNVKKPCNAAPHSLMVARETFRNTYNASYLPYARLRRPLRLFYCWRLSLAAWLFFRSLTMMTLKPYRRRTGKSWWRYRRLAV